MGTSIAPTPAATNALPPLPVVAANVLDGYQSFLATTALTTLITVPAGRTWVGVISASVSATNSAAAVGAGATTAVFSVAGAGAAPTGSVFGVGAQMGANAVGGTVAADSSNTGSTPLVVVAAAGVAATVGVTATIFNVSAGRVDASAIGLLQ